MLDTRRFLSGLLTAGLALVVLLGVAQRADAATLYISEYASGVSQQGTNTAQMLPTPLITTQTVAVGGASVQSAAFNAATHAIQIQCDTGCSVAVGANPTATTSTTLLSTNQPQNFVVVPGQKVAVIANASGIFGGIVLGVNGTSGASLANPLPVQVSNGSTAVTYLAPGQAAMASSTPVAIASDQTSLAVNTGIQTGTAVTGIGTGTTGAVVGTLAGTAAKTTYICNFDVSAIGGTAAIGPVVVAGLVGGSFTYQISSTAAGVTFSRTFTPCIPASTTNTAITVTTTADGTATAVDVNASGFQK